MMSKETINDAARKLAIQCTAQEDFYFFARYMFAERRGFKWQRAPHHQAICDALTRVAEGRCNRLIINIPPRYSKTELAVVNFIAWTLGKNPDAEFIYTSYSARLAANFSWQARELVMHPSFKSVFPDFSLRDDSRAKDEWRTTDGGIVYAVGSGGTITGYGAGKIRDGFSGAIIIDDPHKADEASSDVMRANVIDWFQNTLESRKNDPKTPIILIMQRLHEKDLSGWLLAGGNGEKWEHLCLSAITPEGEALWPAKHTLEDLERMERAAPYVFAGQYRQLPAPPEGGVMKPKFINVVDAIPAGPIKWVRGWDLAAAVNGDYTAGGKLGRLEDGRFIIADMVRERLGVDQRDALLRATMSQDGRGVIQSLPQDPGQAGKTQVLYLVRQNAGANIKTSPESGDKETRATPLAAQINVGNVLMLRGPWNDELMNEMRMFPNGNYDDQVDALSRAFGELLDNGSTGLLDHFRAQAAEQKEP